MNHDLLKFKNQYIAQSRKKNLSGKEAMAAVKQDGYALQYVEEHWFLET